MKLFSKYNRINLLSTVVIFLLGSIAFSFLLRYVINRQLDEDLKIEKNEVITYVSQFHRLPAIIEVHDQYTTYKETGPLKQHISRIHTRRLYDQRHKEEELIRTIEFDVHTNDKWYLVSVSKSLEGADDLIQSIIIITLSLILLILVVSYLINRVVLRRLWQPFHTTLTAMQQFRLSDTGKLSLDSNNIDEFTLLNQTLSGAVSKAQSDYQSLKEFTENASHELQTPLAVIRSKLDILIQNEQLSEGESTAIQGAYDAVRQLSKMNQSLLLLTKIENRQFTEQTNINLQPLLCDKRKQFRELWMSRDIAAEVNEEESTLNGNPQLVDILLNNLLSNATKHNVAGGIISLSLRQGTIRISNTGAAQPLDDRHLFSRFYKGSASSETHGLGLSIIKQICDVSGYTCTYRFKEPNLHSFTIMW